MTCLVNLFGVMYDDLVDHQSGISNGMTHVQNWVCLRIGYRPQWPSGSETMMMNYSLVFMLPPPKNNGTTNVHKYCKCSSRKKRTKGSNGHMLTKRANSAKRADIFISMVGSKKSGLFGGNHGHKTAQHRAQFCAQFGANERNFKEYPSWVWPAIPANIQTTRTFVQNVLKFSRSAEISQMRTFPHFQTHRKLCSCDVRGVYIYLSLSAYHIISH